MSRMYLLMLLVLTFAVAPTQASSLHDDFESFLNFEASLDHDIEALRGWGGAPFSTLHRDTVIVHSGTGAARLERDGTSENSFSTITMKIPLDVEGEHIELRGFLRLEGVEHFAGLWMRQDGPNGMLQFDNMQSHNLNGTLDWEEYSIVQPLDEHARQVVFGALISEQGTLWVDDLQLLVDGEPIREAPARPRELTVLETDDEFDAGSGIRLASVDATQAANLALLGRAWGFLKYHHPRVAGGELHWDYELFRILPDVLDAGGLAETRDVLVDWIDRLGVPESCDPCAEDPDDIHLFPRLDWLAEHDLLGPELSARLQAVHAVRFAVGDQLYVALNPDVGNPDFAKELAYASMGPADSGHRLLALFRYWNIIEYWFPYRNLIDDEWNEVLHEFVPRLVAADGHDGYHLEMMALIARVSDTHANLWSHLAVRPPRGDRMWPVMLRFVENRPMVMAYTDSVRGPASGLRIGDVIETVDGRAVGDLIDEWAPYYCASNRPTMLRDIARTLHIGPDEPGEATIERDGQALTLEVDRTEGRRFEIERRDRPGPTLQLLSDDMAYIKLSDIRVADLAGYVERAAGTRGLVIDIRNYPSEFTVFELGGRLVERPTPFTRFTNRDLDNPGAFVWTESLELTPLEPRYDGRVAILVDESSQSSAEYTAMAFRASPNAVGIVPDIVAEPTIAGMRAGRDEVLEAALRHLVGDDVSEAEIRGMANWPE